MLGSCNSLHNLDMWLSVQYWEIFYSEDKNDNLNNEWPEVNVKRVGNFSRGGLEQVDEVELFGGDENLPMMHNTYSAEDDEYVKKQKVRLEVRKAFLETVSLRRLALLELRRTREKTEWTTGQLCYWWTEKAKGGRATHPSGKISDRRVVILLKYHHRALNGQRP